MTEAALPADDNVGSSHDADVDAAYDDGDPASETAEGSSDELGGEGDTSHDADIDAGYDN